MGHPRGLETTRPGATVALPGQRALANRPQLRWNPKPGKNLNVGIKPAGIMLHPTPPSTTRSRNQSVEVLAEREPRGKPGPIVSGHLLRPYTRRFFGSSRGGLRSTCSRPRHEPNDGWARGSVRSQPSAIVLCASGRRRSDRRHNVRSSTVCSNQLEQETLGRERLRCTLDAMRAFVAR